MVGPCSLAELDLPCLHWLSWQIRGGEGCLNRPQQERVKPTPSGRILTQHVEKYYTATLKGIQKWQFTSDQSGQHRTKKGVWTWSQEHVTWASWLRHGFCKPRTWKQRDFPLSWWRKQRRKTQHQGVASPEQQFVQELIRSQTDRGGELRWHGPMDQLGLFSRQLLEVMWWNWRWVFEVPCFFSGEHINVLELWSILAAVQWRMRCQTDVHSRGLHGTHSFGALSALVKGRSASNQLAPEIEGSTPFFSLLLSVHYWNTSEKGQEKDVWDTVSWQRQCWKGTGKQQRDFSILASTKNTRSWQRHQSWMSGCTNSLNMPGSKAIPGHGQPMHVHPWCLLCPPCDALWTAASVSWRRGPKTNDLHERRRCHLVFWHCWARPCVIVSIHGLLGTGEMLAAQASHFVMRLDPLCSRSQSQNQGNVISVLQSPSDWPIPTAAPIFGQPRCHASNQGDGCIDTMDTCSGQNIEVASAQRVCLTKIGTRMRYAEVVEPHTFGSSAVLTARQFAADEHLVLVNLAASSSQQRRIREWLALSNSQCVATFRAWGQFCNSGRRRASVVWQNRIVQLIHFFRFLISWFFLFLFFFLLNFSFWNIRRLASGASLPGHSGSHGAAREGECRVGNGCRSRFWRGSLRTATTSATAWHPPDRDGGSFFLLAWIGFLPSQCLNQKSQKYLFLKHLWRFVFLGKEKHPSRRRQAATARRGEGKPVPRRRHVEGHHPKRGSGTKKTHEHTDCWPCFFV